MTLQQTIEQLIQYGWQQSHTASFEPYANRGLLPMRITQASKGYYSGTDGKHTYLLSRSGVFQNVQDLGIQPSPVVGDWCAVNVYDDHHGRIEGVLNRSTVFHKPVVHEMGSIEGTAEIVAANIEQAAIIQDAYHDFNLRRIERFLALLQADGIASFLVLTKIDLLEEPESYRLRVQARLPNLSVFLVDSHSQKGIEELNEHLGKGTTTMLLGTSGAGKSTLLNALCNETIAKIREVRDADGRGRHTTTSRQLYLLPGGALILDTPGLRAVGMQCSDTSFSDIDELATQCHFSNCTHTGEKGCAVSQALLAGELEQDRYHHYLQLRQESEQWEDVQQKRIKKDKALGKLLYQIRREQYR